MAALDCTHCTDSASSEQNDFEKLKDESDLWLILNLKSGPVVLTKGGGAEGSICSPNFRPTLQRRTENKQGNFVIKAGLFWKHYFFSCNRKKSVKIAGFFFIAGFPWLFPVLPCLTLQCNLKQKLFYQKTLYIWISLSALFPLPVFSAFHHFCKWSAQKNYLHFCLACALKVSLSQNEILH